jgi:fucose permease
VIRASATDLLWICIALFALGAIFGSWVGAFFESMHWAKEMREQTRQAAPIIATYSTDSEFHSFADDDERERFDLQR